MDIKEIKKMVDETKPLMIEYLKSDRGNIINPVKRKSEKNE